MTATVVIVVAGREAHLARTLAGLAAQRRRADEIVVVDMGDARAVLDDSPCPCRRVRIANAASDPLPVGAARNSGAAAASTEHLIFLDVDCLPDPQLVEHYDSVLSSYPDALACGVVRYLQPAWLSVPDATSQQNLQGCSAPHPARPAPSAPTRDRQRYDLFWSLNFGVTTQTWSALGGFDEGYRGYGAEDTDLAYRARTLDIPLLWFDGGLAYHQWHPPAHREAASAREIVANARRFHERWAQWPMPAWLHELDHRGLVCFDPRHDRLELVEPT